MKEDFIIFLKKNVGFRIVGMILGIFFSPDLLHFLFLNTFLGSISVTKFLYGSPCWVNIISLMVMLINASIGAYFGNAFGESIKHEGIADAIGIGMKGGAVIGIISGIYFAMRMISETGFIGFIGLAFIDSIWGLFIGGFIGLIIALIAVLFWHLFLNIYKYM